MKLSRWKLAALLWLGLAAFMTDARANECGTFAEGIAAGTVAPNQLREASGLASSRTTPGLLWVHNDSGNGSVLFALDIEGNRVRSYILSGASNYDWEALGIGPGPASGQTYLYVGDIGDNTASRSSITVYRVPEPEVIEGLTTLTVPGTVALPMQYPDGARDAEALFVDPETSEIYIVSKNFATGTSGVYRYPVPHDPSTTVTLEKVGEVSLPGDAIERAVTGADISPNGREILIRSYTRGYLWQRAEGSSIANALLGTRCETPIAPEPQGEAITFTWDGRHYITVSEMLNQPIFLYLRSTQVPSASSLSLFLLPGILVLVSLLVNHRHSGT